MASFAETAPGTLESRAHGHGPDHADGAGVHLRGRIDRRRRPRWRGRRRYGRAHGERRWRTKTPPQGPAEENSDPTNPRGVLDPLPRRAAAHPERARRGDRCSGRRARGHALGAGAGRAVSVHGDTCRRQAEKQAASEREANAAAVVAAADALPARARLSSSLLTPLSGQIDDLQKMAAGAALPASIRYPSAATSVRKCAPRSPWSGGLTEKEVFIQEKRAARKPQQLQKAAKKAKKEAERLKKLAAAGATTADGEVADSDGSSTNSKPKEGADKPMSFLPTVVDYTVRGKKNKTISVPPGALSEWASQEPGVALRRGAALLLRPAGLGTWSWQTWKTASLLRHDERTASRQSAPLPRVRRPSMGHCCLKGARTARFGCFAPNSTSWRPLHVPLTRNEQPDY